MIFDQNEDFDIVLAFYMPNNQTGTAGKNKLYQQNRTDQVTWCKP